MLSVKRIIVLTAIGVAVAIVPVTGIAEEKIEGKVIRTNLTACNPRAGGGGCEGSLTLEAKVDGQPQQVPIKVLAGTIIKKGKDYLFLPATQGSAVVVTYVAEKSQKVATSIDVLAGMR